MVIASKFPTSEAVLFRVTSADNDGGKMIRWGWRVKIRQAVKKYLQPPRRTCVVWVPSSRPCGDTRWLGAAGAGATVYG